MMLIGDLLTRCAMVRPERTALIFKDQQMTYKEYHEAANQFAHALQELGVKKGDRVGILSPNHHLILVAYYAIIRLGAIVTPISFWYQDPEIEYAVNKASINVMIVGEGYVDRINNLRGKLPTVKEYISIVEGQSDRMHAYSDLIRNRSAEVPDVEIDEHDSHLMLFTSGTTGVPKGALLSHRNYFVHGWHFAQACDIREESVMLDAYPMFHMAGIHVGTIACHVGATVVIVASPPTPDKVLEAIEKHRCTYVVFVPTVWKRILAYPDFNKYDLTSLEVAMGGSDTMPLEMLEDLLRKTGAKASPQTWGLSEGGCITFLPLKDTVRKLGSSGKTVSSMDLKIIDDNTQELGTNEVGEIIVRGEMVMNGYWDMPEETAKTLRDGWLYTGDLARIDEEGHLYVVGRKKDMIISGGQNIYPVEVERCLMLNAKIKECAVIGIPHEEWGETVMAAIVLQDGAEMTMEEVVAHVKVNIAAYNQPRRVKFLKELPKTAATGKLQKAELKKQIMEELQIAK